jgi:hypothetical protein
MVGSKGEEIKMDRVIYRKWKDTGEVIAFLLDVDANPGFVVSYMHVGQHGEADYRLCLSRTVPAKPYEFSSLARELRVIGYEPVAFRRLSRRQSLKEED